MQELAPWLNRIAIALVAPWGPIATVDEIRVGEDLYDRLKPGDKLCVTLHPGRFGWPWYEAKTCD